MQDSQSFRLKRPTLINSQFLPTINNNSFSNLPYINHSPREQNSSFASLQTRIRLSPTQKLLKVIPGPLSSEDRYSYIGQSNLFSTPTLKNLSGHHHLDYGFNVNVPRPNPLISFPSQPIQNRVLPDFSERHSMRPRRTIVLPPTMIDTANQSIGNLSERKLMQYFERQTAAIEKLTENIQRQEVSLNLDQTPKTQRPRVSILKRPSIKLEGDVRRTLIDDLSGTDRDSLNKSLFLASSQRPSIRLSENISRTDTEERDEILQKNKSGRAINELTEDDDEPRKTDRREKKARKHLRARREKAELENSGQSSDRRSKQSKFESDESEEENDVQETRKFQRDKPLPKIKTTRRTTIENRSSFFKAKDSKKDKIKNKMRSHLWLLVFPRLFAKKVEEKAGNRKRRLTVKLTDNIQSSIMTAELFFIATGGQIIKDLLIESKSLEIVSPPKKIINDKVLDVRVGTIFAGLKNLFDKLILKTNTESISPYFARFLVSISENAGVLPRDFMFEFEIKRLQFTHYATLKNMNAAKSKMVIGSLLLIRILIYKIILRPWAAFPDLKKEKFNKQNILTIASILYHSVMGIYRRTTAIQHGNQQFLSLEDKIKAKIVPLQAFDEIDEVDKQTTNSKDAEPEPIQGMIPKEQLKSFFSDRRKIADQLTQLLDGWHDKIYEISHEQFLQMSDKDKEGYGL